MDDFILSLLIIAVNTFVVETVKALVKRIVSRIKEGTAPNASKDGSDAADNT